MQKLNSKRSNYRQYIQRRCGNIHRTESNDKHHKKNWKKNLTILRENIIDQYQYNMKKPRYMVTRTYYYYEPDRNKILMHNDRVNRVIDDLFNPRGIKDYYLHKDHYLERHKDELIEENDEWKVRIGGFHVHTLITEINDNIFLKPNRNIRKSLNHIYGSEIIPMKLVEKKGKNEVVRQLLTHNITRRCGFVGTGKNSINIIGSSDHKEFDGYTDGRD